MKNSMKNRNYRPSKRGMLLALSLSAGVWGAAVTPAIAQEAIALETLNNERVQFAEDTVVEFEFVESRGSYQSTFGVINLQTGEKTPLLEEVKPSDVPQPLVAPSSFTTDVGNATPYDFLGTPGNTVPTPLAEFEFKANTPYAFYLESFLNGRSEDTFYSASGRNPNQALRVQFGGGFDSLAAGGALLVWDDTGSLLVDAAEQDRDFDDFVVRAGGYLACP